MRIIARTDLTAADGLQYHQEVSVSLTEEDGSTRFYVSSRAAYTDYWRATFRFEAYEPSAFPDDPQAATNLVARAFDASCVQEIGELGRTVMRRTEAPIMKAIRISVLAPDSGSRLALHQQFALIDRMGREALGPDYDERLDLSILDICMLADNTERRFQALMALGPFGPLLSYREDLCRLVDAGLPLIPGLAERLGVPPATVRSLIRAHSRIPLDFRVTQHTWCRLARVITPGHNLDSADGAQALRLGLSTLRHREAAEATEIEMRRTSVRSWARVERDRAEAHESGAEDYLSAISLGLIERAWAPVMMRRFAPLTWARAAAGDEAAADALRCAIEGAPGGWAIVHRSDLLVQRCVGLRGLATLSREWHERLLREAGFTSREDASWPPLLGTVSALEHEMREVSSFAALDQLGKEQQHCVATRAPAIVNANAQRAGLVFCVRMEDETVATAMFSLLDGEWGLTEIRGPRNAAAPDAAVAAARALVPLIKGAWDRRAPAYLAALKSAAKLLKDHRTRDHRVLTDDLEALRPVLPEPLRRLAAEEIADLLNAPTRGPYEFVDPDAEAADEERRAVEAALRALEAGRLELNAAS